MNPYIKYGLYALAGLFAAVAVLVGVVIATFDPNDYKPQIIKLVQEKKQRTLNIQGDIKLAFYPKIGADLGKVSLSERNSSQEFAAVDNVRVFLSLLPLLKKQLIVDQVRIDGLRATLIRNPDGSTNIDDLLKKEEESEQFKFDIDSVKLTNSALTVDDRLGGRKLAISALDLSTGRIANGVPGSLDLGLQLKSDAPKLDARVKLASGFLFDLDAKHYKLDDLKAQVSGEGLEVKLSAPKIDIAADKAEGESVTLEADIARPDGKLHALLTLPGISGNAQALRIGEMKLALDGKQGQNAIQGRLSTPVNGNLETLRFDFPTLAANLTVNNPKFPGGKLNADLKGKGSLDIRGHNAAFALNGRVDESTVRAQLGLIAFAPPAYTFNVSLDRLNLDRYLPPSKQDSAPEQPLDLSALRTLNASGSLHIGEFQASNVKASNLRLEMKADDGRVQLAPLSANLYQGTLNGSLAVNARGTPHVAVQQKLSGVNIGPLLKAAADKDLLEGRGNLNLNVAASGATVGAMKRTLNGTAAVNLRDGAIKGINIAQTLRNAKAKLGTLKGEHTVASNAQEKTDFSELSASFRITNGVAHNDDLNGKSPLLRLAGNGDINLAGGSVDYLAKATVVGTLEGQGGQDLAALKGVTIPVRIRGPFDKLSYSLDFAGIAEGAVKAKVEEKKEEVKGKAREELKKGLQDLFKR